MLSMFYTDNIQANYNKIIQVYTLFNQEIY